MFQQLIASNASGASGRPLTLVCSAIVHGLFILLLVIVPLLRPRNAGPSAIDYRSSATVVVSQASRHQAVVERTPAAPDGSTTEPTVHTQLHSGNNRSRGDERFRTRFGRLRRHLTAGSSRQRDRRRGQLPGRIC